VDDWTSSSSVARPSTAQRAVSVDERRQTKRREPVDTVCKHVTKPYFLHKCTQLEDTHRVRTHAVLLLTLTLTLTFDL